MGLNSAGRRFSPKGALAAVSFLAAAVSLIVLADILYQRKRPFFSDPMIQELAEQFRDAPATTKHERAERFCVAARVALKKGNRFVPREKLKQALGEPDSVTLPDIEWDYYLLAGRDEYGFVPIMTLFWESPWENRIQSIGVGFSSRDHFDFDETAGDDDDGGWL